MKPKVVIIGHSYSSRLSLIRAVAQIGCEVTVVVMAQSKDKKSTPVKPIDCYSKYVSRFYYCVRRERDSLVPLLLEKCVDPNQKVVLIPDGDDVVANIDNNKNILKEHFLFPHIAKEPSSMEYWMEKTHQKQLAKEIGLNVTNATIVEIKDGQYTIPSDLQYPVFPKPLATMNGGKGGMRRCDNAKDLSEALDFIINFRTQDTKVLIEDYKEIDTEYALLGFSDGKEVVIPGILEFIKVSRKNMGIALQGKVIPVTGIEDLLEKFKQLVLAIGFVGVFDVDFYKSEGKYYFCELNLRYGGSGYAITKMGVNLPAMMVKHFYGESIEAMNKTFAGEAVYVNERMCLDDWDYGYISYKEYRKYIKTADIRFIPDAKDTLPEKVYNRVIMKRLPFNTLKRIIGK